MAYEKNDGFANLKMRQNKNGTPYFKGAVTLGGHTYTIVGYEGKSDNLPIKFYKHNRGNRNSRY